MKRILLLLFTVLCVFVLTVPASAGETFEDLSRIYKNLTTYIYKPYFQDSKYFEEFEAQIEYVGELLKDDAITQEEIDTGYKNLKTVYANMMQDTYDYSYLPVLVSHFDQLDGSIFTEDSWKKMVSTVDEIKTELDSPAIYYKTDLYTEESYRKKTQDYIDSFETNYAYAFNRLRLADHFFDEEMTKDELTAYLNYLIVCTNENYMNTVPEFNALRKSISDVEAILKKNVGNDALIEAKNTLDSAFNSLQNKFIDYSVIEQEVAAFRSLAAEDYEPKSYQRYKEQIEALDNISGYCLFFYIPADCNNEIFKNHSENYLKDVGATAKAAQNMLLPIDLVNELQSLCNMYRRVDVMEGLELKSSLLYKAVKEGDELIQTETATKKDYEEAIQNIKESYSDFKTAESFLIEEQSRIIKQDSKTIKMILVSAFLSIALSIGFACIISKQHYGKIDWTK